MEQWKLIDGSNGKYEISNLGRCRKTGTEYYLRLNKSFKYPRYRVPGASQYAHRLVAIAFIPNPNNYETVDHIDGNKENNVVENLQWMTREMNLKKYHDEIRPGKIAKYDKDGNFIKKYDTLVEAYKEINGSRVAIIHCLKGRNKTANGYVWKYE